MNNISVKPLNIKISLGEGETIHGGLERAGVFIETPCGGNGICGGCRVWAVEPSKIPPTPHRDISDRESAKGLRLACLAVPSCSTSILLEDNYVYEKRKQNHGQIQSLSKVVDTSPPSPAVHIVRDGQEENSSGKGFTIIHHRSYPPVSLPCWNSSMRPRGTAIDIGTTTMVVCLIDLASGKVMESEHALNPQLIHGHDVLSRIQYASTGKGLGEMASLVRKKLNMMIQECCGRSDAQRQEIVDVTIGANTTMLQLAAAIDPVPLGHIPFRADIKGGVDHPVQLFGLDINPLARVYIPPVMHAFVGSDISAGLLLCPGFFDDTKSVLYMDMGTNGEICLNVKGRRFTTSTAAGPAFEGMGLSSGMRATDGAVEKVETKNSRLLFHVIGGQEPKGVCGSGIVDFIASLLCAGYLDTSGRLEDLGEKNCPVVENDGQRAFHYGQGAYLNQKDIRQIQLAKGAVRTGIDIILETAGIKCRELDSIYIAGGFGYHLNPSNMELIGLLPKDAADKVIFCGNASIDGSIKLLRNAEKRTFLENTLGDMEHIQLADTPGFMDTFVKNLDFTKTCQG
ncbi:MAG: DUF4445 domain-containing protein [Desulfamplus sp.]|nr:DUF4445 domain-containing protein [Desulfamplus sp.]